MAALCYALQAAAQAALGFGIWDASGSAHGLALALWGLAATSAIGALIHKGRSFEAARAAGAGRARMPWPARYTQMALCLALMILSAQGQAQGMLAPDWAGWVACGLAALAGWAAGQSGRSPASTSR